MKATQFIESIGPVLFALLLMQQTVPGVRPDNPFPHTPTPLPSTVGLAGYIGTSGPTTDTIPGLITPTGYNAPGLNGPAPKTATGPTGFRGPTDYISPGGRSNGQTGVTGLPGMGWP